MLSYIITTVAKKILSALLAREISVSELSRQTGVTKANISRTLHALEEQDLVRKSIHGRTHVYRINLLSQNAQQLARLCEDEKQSAYARKLHNLPLLVHSFLADALKNQYEGCIFFGSSLGKTYNDIDVFVVLRERKKEEVIKQKLQLIDGRISPLFGTHDELSEGAGKQDMLYKNILDGVAFGIDTIPLRHNAVFSRKRDIQERFILGYREILSCLEFRDRLYVAAHLDRGVMDIIYAVLNYKDIFPKNDIEAVSLFRTQLRESKPKTIKEALSIAARYAGML